MSQRSRNQRRHSSSPENRPAQGPGSGISPAASAVAGGGSSSGASTRSAPSARPVRSQRIDRNKAVVPARRDPTRRFLGLSAAAIAVIAVAFFALSLLRGSPPSQSVQGAVSGWPAAPSSGSLGDRVSAAGLQLLNTEGETLHIHVHLDISVNGQPVTVPADVGIDTANGTLSPLHTHDSTGIIHVESPTVRDFTLGEFFQVWGVPLNASCIGTYCAGGGSQLKVWVNGSPVTGDPASISLQAHQEIVIAFGTPAQMPQPVPSSYSFQGGL